MISLRKLPPWRLARPKTKEEKKGRLLKAGTICVYSYHRNFVFPITNNFLEHPPLTFDHSYVYDEVASEPWSMGLFLKSIV